MSDKKIIIYIFLNGKSASIPERLKINPSEIGTKFIKNKNVYTYKNKLLYRTDGRLFTIKDIEDETVLVAVPPCSRFIQAPYHEVFVKFIQPPSTTDTITTCKSNISKPSFRKSSCIFKKKTKSCSSLKKLQPLPHIKQHDCLKYDVPTQPFRHPPKKKPKCCSCCRKKKKLRIRLQRPITARSPSKYPPTNPVTRSNIAPFYCDRSDFKRKLFPKQEYDDPFTLSVYRSGTMTSAINSIAIQTSLDEIKKDSDSLCKDNNDNKDVNDNNEPIEPSSSAAQGTAVETVKQKESSKKVSKKKDHPEVKATDATDVDTSALKSDVEIKEPVTPVYYCTISNPNPFRENMFNTNVVTNENEKLLSDINISDYLSDYCDDDTAINETNFDYSDRTDTDSFCDKTTHGKFRNLFLSCFKG